jgi:hypothetical protein
MGTEKQTDSTPSSPSLATWRARALHTITLPSGQRVRIRIPGIATLLEHGDLPEDLLELALLELTSEGGATAKLASDLASGDGERQQVLERIARYGEFQRHLVCAAVVAVETEPGDFAPVALRPEDLLDGSLPEDDLAMIAEIIQRLRAHDAKGVRIGVEPLDRWATFRAAHGCPDTDCPGCAKLVQALSSADLGAV